jgi:dihydrofolate synthase/folylpolyglutamate synthase
MSAEAILQRALKFGVRPGLERMALLLEGLGNPHHGLRVVHVAGTNGKGSTTAMLASVLRAAGYRVGRYTSPHLVSDRERLWLDGAFPTPEAFDRLLVRVGAVADVLAAQHPDQGPLTEFELLTAAALVWFHEEGCDLAIIEVGLGGRLDATNVFDRPEVTVITGIDLDHTAVLGETHEEIALEKAGILRPEVPLITGASGDALHVIGDRAAGLGVPIRTVSGESTRPLGLSGPYQRRNAALVEAVVEALREACWQIPDRALDSGLLSARWPGRMERWVDPEGRFWLADGAHNPAGIEGLKEALSHEYPGARWTLVFGALADRDAKGMLEQLLPFAETLILVSPPSPRAVPPEELAAGLTHPSVVLANSVSEAVVQARLTAMPCAVFGSLYLVGAVMQDLGWIPQP